MAATGMKRFSYLARASLSVRIFAGLILGILLGLFVGEPAAALQPIADIYISLMQMTVLPYLVLALVIGFGQLDARQARRLGVRAGVLLVLVWAAVTAVIVAMPLAFPPTEDASFFSHSLVEPRKPFSVIELYFTSNPFHSLANGIIPAVVLFSSLLGIFLVGVEGKERVLDLLRVVNRAVEGITRFVVSLTPIGVFAIGAAVAGTMSMSTLERLEVYLITFVLASLLLTFLILPLLVTAVTPFRYRQILGASKDALITAFATSNAFIVLPLLVDRSKALLRDHDLLTEESDSAADILVPVLFNFPHAGRLLTLLFVPFAAWLSGETLRAVDYPTLIAVGIPTYFAKAQVALPFLLDVFSVPHDLFQLYIPTSLVGGKFDSMLTAMNLLVFALLGAASLGGFLAPRRRSLLRAGLFCVVGIISSVAIARVTIRATIDSGYDKDLVIRRMHSSRQTEEVVVHRDLATVSPPREESSSGLDRARRRGTLRIGYDPGNLPFSFFNADSELVGFDVELSCDLAASLKLEPEFVPVAWSELPQMLADGWIDVMPSVWVRPYWFSSVRVSIPYVIGTMGVAVRDERRHDFTDVDALRASRGLRIGVPLDVSQLRYSIERYFDGSDAEFVPLPYAGGFFEGRYPDLDGFLMPAESGAAATLLHPQYTIVVPQPDPVRVPFAFGLSLRDEDLFALVNEWVVFARSEGRIQRAYDYWVLGRGAADSGPRWSVLRDVLGWVE